MLEIIHYIYIDLWSSDADGSLIDSLLLKNNVQNIQVAGFSCLADTEMTNVSAANSHSCSNS